VLKVARETANVVAQSCPIAAARVNEFETLL
jgi:hypothetical protein